MDGCKLRPSSRIIVHFSEAKVFSSNRCSPNQQKFLKMFETKMLEKLLVKGFDLLRLDSF